VRHSCPNRRLANEWGEKHDTEVIIDGIGSPASIPGATQVRWPLLFLLVHHRFRGPEPEPDLAVGAAIERLGDTMVAILR